MTISQVFFREFWSLFTFQFGREGQLILVSVFPSSAGSSGARQKILYNCKQNIEKMKNSEETIEE